MFKRIRALASAAWVFVHTLLFVSRISWTGFKVAWFRAIIRYDSVMWD